MEATSANAIQTAIDKHYRWLMPGLLLLAITPFTPYLDLKISHYFFQDGHFNKDPYVTFFYKYGNFPAHLLGFISLFLMIGSFIKKRWKWLQGPALLLILTLTLGSGVIVNLVLKDHWGRPRPVQSTEFGGPLPFRPFYSPQFHSPLPARSFPCGHCSTGFFFFALVLLGQRYKCKTLFYFGIAMSLFLGLSLSYSRIAKGGHYFSDILFSALIMWWTALILNWLIFDYERSDEKTG
jgi:lipid A 4'-phosphatase